MIVPRERGGNAGYDIMIMFSPGSPISLQRKKEGKEALLVYKRRKKGRKPY
jgi:hypothetical protein